MGSPMCEGCGTKYVRVKGSMCATCRGQPGLPPRERTMCKACGAGTGGPSRPLCAKCIRLAEAARRDIDNGVLKTGTTSPELDCIAEAGREVQASKKFGPGEDITYDDLKDQAEDLREARRRYRAYWYETNGAGHSVRRELAAEQLAQLRVLGEMATALVETTRKWRQAQMVAANAMTPAEVTEEAVTWLEGRDVAPDKKREAVERILRSLGLDGAAPWVVRQ